MPNSPLSPDGPTYFNTYPRGQRSRNIEDRRLQPPASTVGKTPAVRPPPYDKSVVEPPSLAPTTTQGPYQGPINPSGLGPLSQALLNGQHPISGATPFTEQIQRGTPLNDMEAQQRYGMTGLMPNTTVGGRYGQVHDPSNNLSLAGQHEAARYGTRNPYAVTGNPGLAPVPSTQEGFDQQMDWQNPMGRNFGGTLPTLLPDGRGGYRPGFASEPMKTFDYSGRGLFPKSNYTTDTRGRMTPVSGLAGFSPDNTPERKATLAANKAAYQGGREQRETDRRNAVMNRVAIRNGNAGGIGLPSEDQKAGGLEEVTKYAEQLGPLVQSGVIPREVAQQMVQQRLGKAGVVLPKSTKNFRQQKIDAALTPQQQGEFANLKTPEEKNAWLNANGITDGTVRSMLLGSNMRDAPSPGITGAIGDWFWGGLGGLFEGEPGAKPTRRVPKGGKKSEPIPTPPSPNLPVPQPNMYW